MGRCKSLTKIAICLLIASICYQFGCRPQQPVFLGERGNWQSHFIDRATDFEIPNVNVRSLAEVCRTTRPICLENPDPDAMWDLTLEEVMHIALKNSQVIRTLSGVQFSPGGVGGVPVSLVQGGGQARTVFDPALIESDPRFGQEAALAAFDAQLEAGTRWDRNASGRGKNAGTFHLGISKYTAPGTQFFFSHDYRMDRPPTPPLPSWATSDGTWYEASFTTGFRHPLLQGSGIEFNRISGPNAFPGQYSGVAVARINTDMALNDFEIAVRNLVADVERAYWNLYYAYHRLESVRSGRASAYQTWHQTMVQHDISVSRGSAHNLAQSEQNYFEFRRQTELAQNNLFRAEGALRYIMGLTPMDGRLIRPADEPITAPVSLEWHDVLCEALFRSPELRRQQWTVKQRELEYRASRSFLLPRLDLDGGYRITGYGTDMVGRWGPYNWLGTDDDIGGGHVGWLGLSLTMPLGFRQELAAVRNAQLQLTRSRAILRETELELTHQLSDSFREISLAYRLMQTTLASFRAASEEVRASEVAHEEGIMTLDLLLNARRRMSDAETAYYSAVIDYNLAIMTLHYRKGSLLEFNNICLAEGEWPGKAYFDARRRARERDAGRYFNFGLTLPGVLSRGTLRQHYRGSGFDSIEFDALPAPSPIEQSTAPPLAPRIPIIVDDSFRLLEPETSVAIPAAPVLPPPALPTSGGVAPASFSTSDLPPLPMLTPARNMRYVR